MYDDPPQTFNRLRCRDDLPLWPFNDLPSRKNMPDEHLEGFNRFHGCQNGLTTAPPTFNRHLTGFAAIKNVLLNIYKHSSSSAVVKMFMTILHRRSTHFTVVKMSHVPLQANNRLCGS